MQILSSRKGQTLYARLLGELDHHSAAQTREELDRILMDEEIMELILDLSGLTFMDSSGIGVVLGRYKLMCARGGRLAIQKPSLHVDKILRMSGVYGIVRKTGNEGSR